MISRARLRANRQNAKKSTGPRSAAGKLKSSRNAIKHSLTAEKHINKTEIELRKSAIKNFMITLNSEEADDLAHEISLCHQILNLTHSAWDDELSKSKVSKVKDAQRHSAFKKLKLISLYGRRASNRQMRALRRHEELKKSDVSTTREELELPSDVNRNKIKGK